MNSPAARKLLNCKKCPQLTRQLRSLRESHPDYWNLPVPASGPATAKLLIVGLAPGMHGANKTGLPFVGDSSGDLLSKVLTRHGAVEDVRITNAVKCLPVKNLPQASEIANCRHYLTAELDQHTVGQVNRHGTAVVLALGGIAHRAVVAAMGCKQSNYGFAHGAVHELSQLVLIDSYHCSRYNTQTRRLTESMFDEVVSHALYLAGYDNI